MAHVGAFRNKVAHNPSVDHYITDNQYFLIAKLAEQGIKICGFKHVLKINLGKDKILYSKGVHINGDANRLENLIPGKTIKDLF